MRIPSAALAALLLASPAVALETVEEIEKCMEENLPKDASIQTIVMNSEDRVGSVTTTRAKIYWREFEDGKSRVLVRLSDPPDMRGAAILMIEKDGDNETFMYLPDIDKVKRITGRMMSSSMLGTDFSYEDFEQLQGLEDHEIDTRRLDDGEVDGRAAYVIESTPKPDLEEPPNYERTVKWIDKAFCVPLKLESYERGDKLRKRMTVDPESIEVDGGRNVARRIEVHDLRDNTKTKMLIEAIELDPSISRSWFTTRALETKAGRRF